MELSGGLLRFSFSLKCNQAAVHRCAQLGRSHVKSILGSNPLALIEIHRKAGAGLRRVLLVFNEISHAADVIELEGLTFAVDQFSRVTLFGNCHLAIAAHVFGREGNRLNPAGLATNEKKQKGD